MRIRITHLEYSHISEYYHLDNIENTQHKHEKKKKIRSPLYCNHTTNKNCNRKIAVGAHTDTHK